MLTKQASCGTPPLRVHGNCMLALHTGGAHVHLRSLSISSCSSWSKRATVSGLPSTAALCRSHCHTCMPPVCTHLRGRCDLTSHS